MFFKIKQTKLKYSKIIYFSMLFFFNLLFILGQSKDQELYKAVKENNLRTVELLLSENADPNFVEEYSWMKVNLLITAVNNNNYEIAKKLIENKVDVNWKDGFNTDALMYACSKGNIKIVNLLLEHGADINSHDNQGNNVLTAAKESKNKELISLIQNKLKLNPESKKTKQKDLIEKADKLSHENQNYKKANELYTSALSYNENHSEIFRKRGGTFYAMGDFENAIKDFTKVIELNTEDIVPIYFLRGLSKTLLKNEDKKGGCSDIKKAIELGYDTSDLNGLDDYCNFK